MSKKFDPTKPVQMRCGWKAEIIRSDLKGPASIVAIITDSEGDEFVEAYREDGSRRGSNSLIENNFDLVNIPEEVVRYFIEASTPLG